MPEGEIQSLRGECVSFQIAYTFDGYRVGREWSHSFRFARVTVESPVEAYLHARSVRNVPCQYPIHEWADDNYLRKAPGLYPDRLEEMRDGTVIFQKHQWNSLWVDLEVPEDALPGTYPIKVTFWDLEEGEELGAVETKVSILAPVLPPQTLLRTEWIHVDCLADYYGTPVFSEENWKIIENFIAAAAKRGINMLLTPQFTPPLDTAVGRERTTVQLVGVEKTEEGYAFDFSRLRRWVEICENHGIHNFEMSHLFSQWGAVSAPKIVGKVKGELVELFGWNTLAADREYTEFLHAYLPKLREELEELGIAENTYFHISDEPRLEQMESYRAAYESVKEYLKGCNFLEALSDYEFYSSGLVQRPICATNRIQPFLEKGTPGLWAYYCNVQTVGVSNRFMAMSLGRTRIFGVQMFKFGIEGTLHWGYNFYNGVDSMCRIDPYQVTDSCGAYPSGDAFIVYPGKNGVPEESIRMMALSEAVNDFRALTFLSELIGREKVLELIDEDLSAPLTFDTIPAWPEDRKYLSRLRQKVNQAICGSLSKQDQAIH